MTESDGLENLVFLGYPIARLSVIVGTGVAEFEVGGERLRLWEMLRPKLVNNTKY